MTAAGVAQAPSASAIETAENLVVLIRRLRRKLRAMPSDGLTPAQSAVLLRLDKDGVSSTSLLAIAEGVRSQTMTAIVNALDERGLIERSPDPDDGRRHIITLSGEGRKRVSRDNEKRHDWLARTMHERYTPDQLDSIGASVALLFALVEE